MKNPVPQRIKALLYDLDISASNFAKKCGFDRQIVSRMQNGINPSFETLAKILKAYPQINPRWFLLGDSPMLIGGEDIAISEKCSECNERQKMIEDLRRFNHLLQENYDALKEECDKIKGLKKGRVA